MLPVKRQLLSREEREIRGLMAGKLNHILKYAMIFPKTCEKPGPIGVPNGLHGLANLHCRDCQDSLDQHYYP
jgi:hypothetical protein